MKYQVNYKNVKTGSSYMEQYKNLNDAKQAAFIAQCADGYLVVTVKEI